jgi:hypothetical protein
MARHGNKDRQAGNEPAGWLAAGTWTRAKAPQHPMKLEKRKKEGGWVGLTNCG